MFEYHCGGISNRHTVRDGEVNKWKSGVLHSWLPYYNRVCTCREMVVL